jgi:phosphatidylinositol glycan anchor class Y biosynthesis protein
LTARLLWAIEGDVYYWYLVPLTIPVTILACYANWVSLKFFRHN